MTALAVVVIGVLLTAGLALIGWSIKVLIDIRVQLALLTDHQAVTNATLTNMIATEKLHDTRIQSAEVSVGQHIADTKLHIAHVEQAEGNK